MSELKTLRALPKTKGRVKEPDQNTPPLLELPHAKIARLTREMEQTTEALQALKKQWADRNIKAQACRQAVSTPEVAFFEKQKRELALRLLNLQTELAAINKELRANRAARQNGRRDPEPLPAGNGRSRIKKDCPLKDRKDWPEYFMLSAENTLTPELYSQIERGAKSMLEQSLATGIAE